VELDENGGGYFMVYSLGNTEIMALGKERWLISHPCCLDHHWLLVQIKKVEDGCGCGTCMLNTATNDICRYWAV